jgi:hypothetical protein
MTLASAELSGYGQALRAQAPDHSEQVEHAVAALAPMSRRRMRDWRPTRGLDTPAEGLVLAAAQDAVEFSLLAPHRLPWGYFLAEQTSVPRFTGFVTLCFRSRGGGQWWITQRTSAFSLEEEMVAAGERCAYVTRRGRKFAVSQSARIGEPVEWHWSSTRQLICWHQEDRMCELEAVRNYAPDLEQLLAVADRLGPAAPLVASSLCRAPRAVLRGRR